MSRALRLPDFQIRSAVPGQTHSPDYFRATVDGRTGAEWLQSAIDYCSWRAGDSWRRLSSRDQRNDPERWHYLGGLRVLSDLLHSPEPQVALQVVLPPVNSLPTISPEELKLRLKSRGWLVAELLRVDATLTDAKLLSRLGCNKLAAMLAERLAALPVEDRRRA